LNPAAVLNAKSKSDSFLHLLQIIRDDPVVNKRVTEILQLNPFRRRLILNRWLEQLRFQDAPKKLLQALSSLFDDDIAEKTLALINK